MLAEMSWLKVDDGSSSFMIEVVVPFVLLGGRGQRAARERMTHTPV